MSPNADGLQALSDVGMQNQTRPGVADWLTGPFFLLQHFITGWRPTASFELRARPTPPSAGAKVAKARYPARTFQNIRLFL
jgi:hypothetical protein